MDKVRIQNKASDQSGIRPCSTNYELYFNGRIKKNYFILTHLYCKTSFALHMTFCMSQSALHTLSDFLHLCVGVESVSKIL